MAYMAITGDNFCTSAWNGFLLNLKHAGEFGSVKFLAGAVIFLGKASITILNIFTCYTLVRAMGDESSNTDAPCLVVGLLTWFSCEIWLTIFDQAILGIMTSFAVDFDINDGQPARGP